MSHDSHETAIAYDWLTLSLQFQHGKNKKDTKNGGRKKGPPSMNQGRGACRGAGTPISGRLPIAERETPPVQSELPTLSELEKRAEEAKRLGEVGRSPESSPTQQLAQMAAEAGPSMSGGEEPARRKICPTMGGKAPQKEFLRAGKVKKPQKYWPGTEALHKINCFQKSMDLLIHKLPFSH